MKFLSIGALLIGMIYPVYYFMCLRYYMLNKWQYDKLYKREMTIKFSISLPIVLFICFLYSKLIIELFGGR
jgi:hypothetical protein